MTPLHSIVRNPEYVNTRLTWYGSDLTRLADRFGTPLHVGCSEAAADSYRSFMEPFSRAGIPMEIFYSVKTNPVPRFLERLYRSGSGFEIVAGWEYRMLREMGVADDRILYTGDIEDAVTDKNLPGFRLVTVSTPGQLQKLADLQKETGQSVRMGLTINPNLMRGFWDITLNTSRKGSPLGFHLSSDHFEKAVRTISAQPGLELVGLHMHLGSAIHSAKPFLKGIDTMAKAAFKLKKSGITISMLDIGGGFGLPTAPMMKIRSMVSSLLGINSSGSKKKKEGENLELIAQKLTKTIANLKAGGVGIEMVAAEPGRLLSGPCQMIILEVRDVIHKGGRHYLLCDAGAMSLSPMLLTEDHRILPLQQKDGPEIRYEVLGKLPSALDRVSPSAMLPDMRVGDRIALLDTGAYVVSMNNTFNGPRPPIAWIEDGRVQEARKQESEEKIFSEYGLNRFLNTREGAQK